MSRRLAYALALAVVLFGVAWLLRAPEEAALRALARQAADADHGVVFVSEVGGFLDQLHGVLQDEAGTGTVLPRLPSWLRSAPGLLVVGPQGLEARLDLAPGRAMATKFLGLVRRDPMLRGGRPARERSALVWWERGLGRSTSRWALARPDQARHLLELDPAGRASTPVPDSDAWLDLPGLGPWHVWFGPSDPQRIGLIAVPGSGEPLASPVGPPQIDVGSVWRQAGLDGSDLLGPSTWLLSAERDEDGGRVTLWRRSMARRDGASVDLEIPRIGRWATGSEANPGGKLPAQDVVRRLGGEVQRDARPDGTSLVGYDTEALRLLDQESERLRALLAAIPDGGSVWFARPAALASWWSVAREFGRFGRAPEPVWWEQEAVRNVLERVETVRFQLGPQAAAMEIALASPPIRP